MAMQEALQLLLETYIINKCQNQQQRVLPFNAVTQGVLLLSVLTSKVRRFFAVIFAHGYAAG